MSARQVLATLAAVAISVGGLTLATPTPARAAADPQCIAGGALVPGGCGLGGPGGIASTATSALTAVTLGAVVAWVVSGAKYVLNATAQVLSRTTTPQLTSTWFSGTYWRVAGIAAVLTLPFLLAATVQGLIRSDLSLLIRATFGYLPLAALAVGIAAPLTMLLLAASDQMSAIVSSAAGNQGIDFLAHATALLGSLAASFGSPFVLFLVGLLTVGGALVLWIELLVREAAVYVIVLMLPLAFAAFVWPARRVWAIRSIELLIALVLSKFVIVAVLSLGGAALDQSANRSVTGLLAGGVLMALASFAPWALLRLIPLAEVASAAAGSLRNAGTGASLLRLQQSDSWATEGDRLLANITRMRDTVGGGPSAGGDDRSPPRPGPEPAGTATSPSTSEATGPSTEPGSTPEAEAIGSATGPGSSPARTASSTEPSSPPDAPPEPTHQSWYGDRSAPFDIEAPVERPKAASRSPRRCRER